MRNWVIGVDVGGTFTDFAAREGSTGRLWLHKCPSTPHDPSEAILSGLSELQQKAEIPGEEIERFAHGTTVATNALLQRRGAGLGVVTTRGFRDLLEIGRQVRPAMYDLQADAPLPLADRKHRLEITERIDARGEVLIDLTDAAIDEVIAELRAMPDIESVAVCLLFSFLNPDHEQRIAVAIRYACPDLHVSISSEVRPEFREFERFSTTMLNAFLQPEVSRYMDRLKAAITKAAPNAAVGIFQSSGGLMSIDKASRFPVRTVMSGPAAGAVGATAAAALSGIKDIITLDMGGTSTDVCLILNGETATSNLHAVAGFQIRLPMVDINTVGAGGGSIAHLGADGLLKVGPNSAGARPGPACYAKGGVEPTVSDANLVLGRLPIQLAGGLTLDANLARAAVARISEPLGISLEKAALGVAGIVASNMTRAIRAVSIEKGQDPRRFTLMAFGGAGGLHAADVATALGMSRILIPHVPGILCAEGLIVADLQENYVAACRCPLDGGKDQIAAAIARLSEEAEPWLASDIANVTDRRQTVSLDLRYIGQNYELSVEVGSGLILSNIGDIDTVKQLFFEEHERAYGHFDRDAPVEVVNVRLKAEMALAKNATDIERSQEAASVSEWQEVWFTETAAHRTPIYERNALPEGSEVQGPAIITQFDSTTLLPPDWTLRVDSAMNMIMERKHD